MIINSLMEVMKENDMIKTEIRQKIINAIITK